MSLSRITRVLCRHVRDVDPGVSTTSVGAALGISRSDAGRLLHGDRLPTPAEVVAYIDHVGMDTLAAAVARAAGGTYLPAGENAAAVDLDHATIDLFARVGELAAGVRDALADLRLTTDERGGLRNRVRSIKDSLALVEAALVERAA